MLAFRHDLTIKLGVQGRVIQGPGGGPGQIDVPVRFALVQEGIQPKTLWTKFYRVPVTITEGQPSVAFTHIEEDMTVPMPGKDQLEAYVLYVGFDPMGLQQRPRPRRAAPSRKSAADLIRARDRT